MNKLNNKGLIGWLAWSIVGFLIVVVVIVSFLVHNQMTNNPSALNNNSNSADGGSNTGSSNSGNTNSNPPQTNYISVTNINPQNNSQHQNVYTNIVVTFSESINPSTMNQNNFRVTDSNNTLINGTISSDVNNRVWTFNPSNNLRSNTNYVITIDSSVEGISNNFLANNYVSQFTAGSASGGGGGGSTTILVLTSITLVHTTNLTLNSTRPVNAHALDQFGNVITSTLFYNSSNTSVATVNSSTGLVTAIALGNSTITVSSGTLSNNSIVFVQLLNNITLSPSSANLVINSTRRLNATDQFGNVITSTLFYNSSNTSVATVNSSTGLVTAIALGNSTITAGNATLNASSIIFVVGTLPTNCLAVNVDLGTASTYVILSKAGISTTGLTSIVGDMGVSPIDSTAITGFGLIADPSNQWSTSSLVTGKIYASDYAVPTPAGLTTSISNMETAYTTANGQAACVTELGAGNIGGLTLPPGVYKWGTDVTIPTNVVLNGNSTDLWVFQIAGKLDISSATNVTLTGGALAKNVFWIVADQTTLGTTSNFNGNVMDQTAIVLNTGAKLNGRALSQTAVTLDANQVTIAN